MTTRWLRIFAYELRRNVRRKGYLFGTFGVPIIGFILVLGFQALGAPKTTEIGPAMMNMPVDLDGIQRAGYVDQAGLIADARELTGVFSPYPDEAAARAALDARQIDVYYVIPPHYLETGEVTQVIPELSFSFINQDGIRRLLLNALADDVQSPQVFERLVNPAQFDEVLLQRAAPDGMEQDEISTMFIVYIFAILLLMSLFMTSSYLMQSVIEEKESRLIEILIASVRPLELLGGKILALGLLGLFQMVTWLGGLVLAAKIGSAELIGGALQLFTNFYVPPELIALTIVYFILAYVMFAAAFAAIGALSNSIREGPQYAAIFTLPAVIPMWFLQLVIAEPNGAFAVFLSMFPLTAPLGMIERMAATDVPLWQVTLSLLLLVLGVIGSMWFAGRLFRVQTLLAGQPPRLRDLPRLVRG